VGVNGAATPGFSSKATTTFILLCYELWLLQKNYLTKNDKSIVIIKIDNICLKN
jgi:hypothetical protein